MRPGIQIALTLLLAALASAMSAGTGWSQPKVFLTEPQALRAALGEADAVHPLGIALNPTDLRAVENGAGYYAKFDLTRCFQGVKAGHVIGYACIDNMQGKDRLITYIVRIDHPAGRIGMMEIMEYREAIGNKVNEPFWRNQFLGKAKGDAIQHQIDIRNLSGATLSSRALARGARKLVHLYEVYLRPKPAL